MTPDVLYEDNHLLIVNKPAGLLTQPSGTEQQSLESICKQWLKQKYAKPGNVFLEAAHRLDKPVSGIVVFAKTSKALSRLHTTLRGKEAVKIYWALVDPLPKQPEGTLEHFLEHGDYQARVVPHKTEKAKLARLHYRFIEKNKLEITLETGRYHQIRAQLSAIGSPIIGDTRYGSSQNLPGGIIALHHRRLEIRHPFSGVILVIEAPEWKGT